ncbi:hypothetical protein [Schaalia sp. ZJ1691]|uniref:hypothetical protein n=1 Tax=Schaalia sp. ZJ1691 TaxID=2709404 RepID=UPI0013ED9563|nr:hypothetical protein [Schaalia sp. ZJ1691]
MTTTTAEQDQATDLVQALAAYVGNVPVTGFLTDCTREATSLVASQVGDAIVPDEIKRRAILEVAAELFHRKSAPNGIKNFADGLDGTTAIRVARDALVAARPLLAPYLPLGFA